MLLSMEGAQKLDNELLATNARYDKTLLRIAAVAAVLTQEKAKQYLMEGVGRRHRIIHRCINSIFSIFPPKRRLNLTHEEVTDISLHLHAFFVNQFGLLDNLAWVLKHERQWLESDLQRRDIGLFGTKIQKFLNEEFSTYLGTRKNWHNSYLKDFRDACSHRIPPYVPPYAVGVDKNQVQISEQAVPWFSHSLDESKVMILHGQLINDAMTIEEIIDKYCDFEFPQAVNI